MTLDMNGDECRTGFGLLTERDLLDDFAPHQGNDQAGNRVRRHELMGSLPGRIEAVKYRPEDLLDAGPRPVFPALAMASLLGLILIGALTALL